MTGSAEAVGVAACVEVKENEQESGVSEEKMSNEKVIEEMNGQKVHEESGKYLEDGELYGQEGDAEGSEEARRGRARVPPTGPTAEQLRIHRLTHYPFRSWCPACVAGRAKNWPHLRQDEVDMSEVPTICFDYCFLSDQQGDSVPVLVGREKGTKFMVAHVVPFKGGGADWLVGQLLRYFRRWECTAR